MDSPPNRLDVSVNLLSIQALEKGVITILGGKQKTHHTYKDLVDVFIHFLDNKVKNGIYNTGFENLSILNLGKTIQKKIDCKIQIKKDNDSRSYNLDSTKLLNTGFLPKYSIVDAIDEIKLSFSKKKLYSRPQWYSVKWLKSIKVI